MYELVGAAVVGLVLGVALGIVSAVLARRRAQRSILPPKPVEVRPALVERVEQVFDTEVFTAAIVEQVRREKSHTVPLRPEQRVKMIQQRLSRAWGDRAYSDAVTHRIESFLKEG